MQNQEYSINFSIDGYSISARFAEANNEVAFKHIRNILISSALHNCPAQPCNNIDNESTLCHTVHGKVPSAP